MPNGLGTPCLKGTALPAASIVSRLRFLEHAYVLSKTLFNDFAIV